VRFQRLSDWLEWQKSLHPVAVHLGLERGRVVANAMGWNTFPFLTISVAGTNGKGSCVAMLDAILTAAGWRVGTYTSPHLRRYNERITVGGKPVGDDVLMSAFARLDAARGDRTLTFFEFGTLAAVDIFLRQSVDVAILEVGLGGRLDAVNLFDAEVALVTSVGIEHTELLGADRESIGREKAGIFRPRRPAVVGDRNPPASVVSRAGALAAPLYRLGAEYDFTVHARTWDWWCGDLAFAGLPLPGLAGAVQFGNASSVLAVLWLCRERLPVSTAAVAAGLARVRLEGRFQVVPGPVEIVIDVAHNPEAAAVLAAELGRRPRPGGTRALVGMLADKDHRAVLRPFRDRVRAWYVTELETSRAARAVDLAAALAETGVTAPVSTYDDVTRALRRVRRESVPGDRIVVFGSFYTAGAVLARLDELL